MSEANALVERMGVAVRTAYKAIEVLKVENQSLKLENEALRKQILLLGGSVSTALSDDPANELQATDSRINVGNSSKIVPASGASSVSAHYDHDDEEELPAAVPAKEHAPVISELGMLWQKPRRLGNEAVAASNIVTILADLQPENLHLIARYIHPVSTDTICKALFEMVTSYIDTDIVSMWSASVAKWSAGLAEQTSVSLLPTALLRKLDLLVAFLVSLCGRTSKGLVAAHGITSCLRKVIVGNARILLNAPHYAQVFGTLRCEKAETYTVKSSYVSEDTRATAHEDADLVEPEGDGVAEDHVSESEDDFSGSSSASDSMDSSSVGDSDDDGHSDAGNLDRLQDQQQKIAQQQHEQQRKAALSSMFGLDSDSDCESAAGFKQEERDAFGGMTDDNAMLVEEDEEQQLCGAPALSSIVVKLESNMTPTAAVINDDGAEPKEHHEPVAKVHRPEDLVTASRVYLLLTTLLRLRQESETVTFLRELWLTTAGNVSRGVIVGVVQVFGSERFQQPTRAVKDQLSSLLAAWCQDLQPSSSTNQSTPASSNPERQIITSALQWMIDKVWRRLGHTGDINSPFSAPVSHRPLPPLDFKLDPSVSTEPFSDQLPAVFRKHGFWGSVNELVKLGETSAAPTGCFATLGLDGVGHHSEILCKLLHAWEPIKTNHSGGEDQRDLPTTNTFVSGFVQSSAYVLSQAQHTVHRSMCASKILPTKLVAEDALVTEFTAYWRTRLTSHLNEAPTNLWEGAHRALSMVNLLLDSFLSTEYDSTEGGWRTGASGDAFRLSARLANRLVVAEAALKKLPLSAVPHFVASSAHVPLKSSLQWLQYSSVTGHQLLHVAGFLDHCTRYVFAAGLHLHEQDSAVVEMSESAVHLTAARKLHGACTELVCLLALSSAEGLISVLTSSLRGMLCAVRTITESPDGVRAIACVLPFVHETIRVLMVIPAPWSGSVRADVQHDVHTVFKALSVAGNLSTFPVCVRRSLVDMQSAWMLRQTNSIPVFMINLDKRTDRWRRTLVMLSPSGLSAVRVRAYDGTGDRSGYATQLHGAQGSQGTVEAPALLIHAEDDYSHIPESDVLLTWDSTLNSKFDARYLANKAVACTATERACAASHLRAWRAIAASRGFKSSRSKASEALVKASSRKSTGGSEPVQLVTTSPETIYKTLLQLQKAARGVPTGTRPPSDDAADSYLYPQEGTDYYIVLEDDVAFPQQSLVDLRATVRALMRALPADVDVLYLSGVLPKDNPHFKLTHKKDEPFYGINYAWTLQAYVLRPRAVEVLLSKLPIWAPVDNFVASLIYNEELKACIVTKKLTHKLTKAMMGVGKSTHDSDVRPSGKSYITNLISATRGADKKTKGDKRKRTKLTLF